MPRQRFFAGNTLASFARTDPGVIETTTPGRFDSAYVSNSIFVPGGASIRPLSAYGGVTSTPEIGVVFEIFLNAGGAASPIFTLNNAAGSPRVRLAGIGPSSPLIRLEVWDGSVWVGVGPTVDMGASMYRVCVHARVGEFVRFYLANTLHAFTTSVPVAVDSFDPRPIFSSQRSSGIYLSQMMATNDDCRDCRMTSRLANAIGAYTDGSGSAADIAEPVLDDSTAAILTAVGQRRSFTKAPVTVPPGYVIGGMGVNLRGRVSGANVSDGKVFVKRGAFESVSGGLGLSAGYEQRGVLFEQDPATATRWIEAGFNAAEFGFEAV